MSASEWIIAAAESGCDLIFTNTITGNVYKVGVNPGQGNTPHSNPGYEWVGLVLIPFGLYLLYDYFFGAREE